MNNLVSEISKLLLMSPNTIYPVYQKEDVVYLSKGVGSYSIAIPFETEQIINESFVGIDLKTSFLNFNDKNIRVLYLTMSENGDIEKFSYIGAEFIDIKNRANLLKDPYSWIDAWKQIFGDAKKKYLISDVIAELVSLKCVYSNNKTAKWVGPKDGTHDIVFDGGVVEVKSTTNKTNSFITISSKFQIDPTKNEKLYFVRLEANPYGVSIDSLVKEIACLGYNESEIEENLDLMGYSKGKRIRNTCFNILEVVSYEVNESTFPIVTLEKINNLSTVKNIINFKLTLDLATIKGTKIL